jgi:hypothetical protein
MMEVLLSGIGDERAESAESTKINRASIAERAGIRRGEERRGRDKEID